MNNRDNYSNCLLQLFKQSDFPAGLERRMYDLLSFKKIILYGAGSGFFTFSAFVLNRYGFQAELILDTKFGAGENFHGLPACSPRQYVPTANDCEEAIVIITVGKEKFQDEIFNCLHRLGFKNIITAADIYEYHLPYVPADLEQKGFGFYLDNQKKILAGLNSFVDETSREIYVRFIKTHMTRMPQTIPSRPLEEQYFPDDISADINYKRVINCGSYTGDTVRSLNQRYGKIERLACFEPDPENFKQLVRYLDDHHQNIAENLSVFPCAAFDSDTILRFISNCRVNSALSDKGDTLIQAVTLDHALPGFAPTFIGMDVEGAELAVLRGSEKLVKEYRPALAVCVYHAPNDIWDIPLYLGSLRLDYKFYLRNYTGTVSETVLYAFI